MKYLILGAGVAGLTFAIRLKQTRNEDSFLMLEKNAEVGGLCRSISSGGGGEYSH